MLPADTVQADKVQADMLQADNLWSLVVARAEATPAAEMAVDQRGRRISFAQFRTDAERLAAGLADSGLQQGDVVSWQLPSTIESLTLAAALRRIGVVQNPILPIYRDREVGFIVRQAKPDRLLVPAAHGGFDFAAMAARLTEGTSTEVVVLGDDLPSGDPATLPPAPIDQMSTDADVRWLFYSSGTTADPKGAQHADIAPRTAAVGMIQAMDLRDDDRVAFVFPITHIGGVTWLWAALATGCTLILDAAFNPATTIDLLAREGVTQAGAATFFHQVYLTAQAALPSGECLFPDVRTFPGGGSPKPPQLHHDLKEKIGGLGVLSGYGLTEAPILTMASVGDSDSELANSEGKAVAGVALRLVTLQGSEAGIDEEGEVRAKGPQITRGYLDPSLDLSAFDEDGWFKTGDLGKLDAAGNLRITGRIKDVIIRKGENISAKEVEDLLSVHPAVADVAVIGLPHDTLGEQACAVVVTPPEVPPLDFETMQQHLLDAGLITRKLPERLEHVPALPRNPTGKVLKFKLREQFGE
ncbi:MAG: cyclohexanecarboxylate-CoA ligase [Glaciecola sp.]|jgi:cyclohexanecarboxylate-CoA ligase